VSDASFAALLELGAGAVLVCSVVTLWRRSLGAIVRVLSLQGAALGAVTLVLGLHDHDGALVGVAVLVVAEKGVALPAVLMRLVARDPTSRELSPLVNVPASLVATGALTLLAFTVATPVVALVPTVAGRLAPLGLATMLIGLFAMAVRRKAVSQIVGLLLVDNGIALVAFLATGGFPLVVELGASLDVLLVVVVARVLGTRMHARFGVVDLDELRELHD